MKKVKFEQIGRNCYNPAKMVSVQGLEIWPGCFTSINKLESGMLVQLELSYKCIRQDTLLEQIEKMRGRNLDDINADLQYKSIVTRYGNNKKTY